MSITATITSVTVITTSPFYVVNAQLDPLLLHARRRRTAGIWQRYDLQCKRMLFPQLQCYTEKLSKRCNTQDPKQQ